MATPVNWRAPRPTSASWPSPADRLGRPVILERYHLGCLAHASYLVGDERSRQRRSSSLRSIRYGLCLGIDPPRQWDRMPQMLGRHPDNYTCGSHQRRKRASCATWGLSARRSCVAEL